VSWYKKHFREFPENKTNTSTRFFLIFISVICFIWTGLASLSQDNGIAAIILLPFIVIVIQNVIQHIYWNYLFREYAPGIISSVFLLLPISIVIVIKAYIEGFLPLWYLLLLLVLMVPGIIQTIKAKDTLAPSFQKINEFSNKAIRIIDRFWLRRGAS